MKTKSELHCVHGVCVILQKTINIGDKLGVDLIVRRKRSRGVAFRDDPSVLGRNEFEGSVDKIAEAGAVVKNHKSRRQKERTYSTGRCCWPPPNACNHKLIAHPSHESTHTVIPRERGIRSFWTSGQQIIPPYRWRDAGLLCSRAKHPTITTL